jgi:C_GCAxxG_C_C family probable redox protein
MYSKRVEQAVRHFQDGFNCSQAVLASFAAEMGLDECLALRLATPFGGGMGRRGEVCGAVSGALMVLGLQAGTSDPQGKAAKEAAYQLAERFHQRFEARHDSILCRELVGCDIRSPQGLALARAEGRFESRCPHFVQSAAEILEELLP